MGRQVAFLRTIRAWIDARRIADVRPWLETHGLVPLFPDLYGMTAAREHARRIMSDTMLLQITGGQVIRSLRENNLPVVALKGLDLLERVYKGREHHRPMGDIDLLVDASRFDEALALVERLGYVHSAEEPRAVQRRWGKDVTFVGPRGVLLEIHRELFLDMGFTLTYDELERGGHLEQERGPAGSDRLTPEALLVHLLVHMAAHRFGADSLRWVLDILLLLDLLERRLDPDHLVEVAGLLRGRRAAGASVASMARLLPSVDLGPLLALPVGGLRERWALRLIDAERSAVEGPGSWTRRRSVLSRMLLDPSPATTAFRKLNLVRGRRSRERDSS